MRALTCHGAKDVRETVPGPGLQAANDILLRASETAVYASDLHIYRGEPAPARAS